MVGRVLGAKKHREYLNSNTNFKRDIAINYVCPIVFLFMSLTYLITNIQKPYDGYPIPHLFTGGWGIVVLTIVFGVMMSFLPTRKDKNSLKGNHAHVPYDGYPIPHLFTGGWGIVVLTIVFGVMMSFLPTRKDKNSLKGNHAHV